MKNDDQDAWGPPLSEEDAEKLKEFCSRPSERRTIIIADDPEDDSPVEPATRQKILDHYEKIFGAFALPKEVLEQAASIARANTKAALALFQCGPSTSPCGPGRDDHQWDDWVEFTNAAGRVTGGSLACSRCGITAMDFDMWNAP
jgi:hypothetical protein